LQAWGRIGLSPTISSASDREVAAALAFGVHLARFFGSQRVSRRRSIVYASVVAAIALSGVATLSCAREPTDPSRSDLTGLWKSFDRDLYIYNIEMEITQARPGIVVGKWRALGRTDNRCTPGIPCKDSSAITGRTEVAQVVLELLGAGTFVGEQPSKDLLKGIIRSETQNFHVTFTRQ